MSKVLIIAAVLASASAGRTFCNKAGVEKCIANNVCGANSASLCESDSACGFKCKAENTVLENPSDVGGNVKTFCVQGCQKACPSGAKGPGWYLPGGRNDALAELRWDDVQLNYDYFTVAMWVKRDNINNDIGLFSYGDYPTPKGFMCQMRSNYGDFHVRAASPQKPSFTSFNSGSVSWTNALVVQNWVHVAVVKTPSEIRFYVNGEPKGTNTAWIGKPTATPANRHFNVGSWYEGGKILQGYVSNIHVFTSDSDSSMAYSNADIKALYDAENGSSYC